MNPRGTMAIVAVFVAGLGPAACASDTSSRGSGDRPRIVVTYSVLGAVVEAVAGSSADVSVLMPNGADPHDWSPSAKDVESLLNADLVVENGLGLEGNLQGTLNEARADGGRVFTVSEHVTVRKVKAGEGADASDPDQAVGADDPHLWMDPLTMKQWIEPLVAVFHNMGIDAAGNGDKVEADLESLHDDVASIVARIPVERRKLVTGHESMGYFADRYKFELIGAVIPSISSQAEASAGELAELTDRIRTASVPAIFVEIGTPSATAEAIASDTGAEVVELSTHSVPADGTYRSFLVDIATAIADGLS